MTNVQQFRQVPDLVQMVADLSRRLSILENARRIGNASIDSGQLTVKNGDIVVVNDEGEHAIEILHGTTPIIRLIPTNSPDGYHVSQFAWQSDTGDASYEVHIEQANGTRDGSKLLLQRSAAYLSHQPATGAEAFLACGDLGLGTEHMRFRGRWVYNNGYDEQDAIICGYDSFGSGFGASSYTFPFAFDQIPIVQCNIFNAGTPIAWDLSALSTTGFQVSWNNTTAKTVMWVAFRR